MALASVGFLVVLLAEAFALGKALSLILQASPILQRELFAAAHRLLVVRLLIGEYLLVVLFVGRQLVAAMEELAPSSLLEA